MEYRCAEPFPTVKERVEYATLNAPPSYYSDGRDFQPTGHAECSKNKFRQRSNSWLGQPHFQSPTIHPLYPWGTSGEMAAALGKAGSSASFLLSFPKVIWPSQRGVGEVADGMDLFSAMHIRKRRPP